MLDKGSVKPDYKKADEAMREYGKLSRRQCMGMGLRRARSKMGNVCAGTKVWGVSYAGEMLRSLGLCCVD